MIRTLHWEQVNDPAQISYACFLMDHGMAPYRDMIEMNMPGIYLVNWTVMHTLGGGALAWRFFDFGLMLTAAWAMIAIARPYDWLAGVWAAGLFILFHGRDGSGQTGQRDLVIAVLLLCSYAFLFQTIRGRRTWPMLCFGICSGMAITIKPTPLPFVCLLLFLLAIFLKKAGRPFVKPLVWAVSGMLLPLGAVLIFLVSKHSLGAFLNVLEVTLPYYATLGRRSPGALLTVAIPSSLWMVAALAALLIVLKKREPWNWESTLIGLGAVFGLATYLGQGKGFPYHRYPLLAFLLLWSGIEFAKALRRRGLVRVLGIVGLGYGAILAPICLREARNARWNTDYIPSLTSDLNRLGGESLSYKVQCLSTLAECHTVLYRMHLIQSTGLFYDFLIFGPAQQQSIREARALFWKQLQVHPPEVFVVNAVQFPRLDGYTKLDSWPLFHQYLTDNYLLYDDRSFAAGKPTSSAYRIYVRKDDPQRDSVSNGDRPVTQE